jgi:F-type H+-transporting ATPase subunit b
MRALLKLLVLALFTCVVAIAQEHAQPAAPEAATTSEKKAEAAPAHAAGPEHKEEGGDSLHETEEAMKTSASVRKLGKKVGIDDPKTAYWLFAWLNFSVIGLAVFKVLKKSLPGFFKGRTASIQKDLETARRLSAESSARLSAIEARLANLDSEIVAMREQAERDGKAEEDRLRAATEDEKRKIVEAAQQEISAATDIARRDLKNHAAELAIELAEKRLAINETTDRALVREFAKHLGNGEGRR